MTLAKAMERAVLGALTANSQGLTRTELLARVLHYRALPDKFLFFSIRERELLKDPQGPRYDEAALLLNRVKEELTALLDTPEMQRTLANREERQVKRASREAQRAALFAAPPPPPPVILKPARRVLVAGSAIHSVLERSGQPSSLERMLPSLAVRQLEEARRTLATMGMAPPIYETVAAETAPHPYEAADHELRRMMQRYPAVVWSRLPTEQEMRDDDRVMGEYEARKRALNRAVDALEKRGEVKVSHVGPVRRVQLAVNS